MVPQMRRPAREQAGLKRKYYIRAPDFVPTAQQR